MPDMNKCYSCKFRSDVPGSTHSGCEAADFATLFIAALVGRGPDFNQHGISHGWANWPIDFDPVWLQKCDLYKPKE